METTECRYNIWNGRKYLPQFDSKKSMHLKKWATDLKRCIFRKRPRNSQEIYEKCSLLLIIREIHIKTSVRQRLTPVRMTSTKRRKDNK